MKTKKYLLMILLTTFVMQLSACKTDSSDPQAATPALAPSPEKNAESSKETEGGISAGGGGTLPADPIAEHEIWKILETAKMQLRMYINYKRFYSDRLDKYFDGDSNLVTILEKTDIEVLSDAACKDAFGRDVDASIHASKPNTICLSIPRIQPKLIKEIANKEILALLIHEFTHLLGASEEDAVHAQKNAVFYLGKLSEDDTEILESTMWGLSMDYPSFLSIHTSLKTGATNADYASLRENLSNIRKTFSEMGYFSQTSPIHDLPFSIFDYRIKEYLEFLDFKVGLAEGFIDDLQGNGNVLVNPEKCFIDKQELTFAELKANCYKFASPTMFDGLKIKRLKNLSELPDYMNDVILAGSDLGNLLRAIAFNQAIPQFNLPGDLEKENAFAKFAGIYTAKEIICESTWTNSFNAYEALTQLEIRNSSVSYPIEIQNVVNIKTIKQNMWSDRPVYNGGQYAMLVTGDATSAQYTEERGTRWYDRQGHSWSKDTFQIQDINGKLVLNVRTDGFQFSIYTKNWEAYQSCQYELIKQ